VSYFDYAVLGIVAVSMLLGFIRGLVSEVLALVAWGVAIVAAKYFGVVTGIRLAPWIPDGTMQMIAGMALVFVGVLVGFTGLRWLVSMMVRAAGMGLLDRALGACFGILRGGLVVVLGVLVAGLTSLPKEIWWRSAMLAPPLETAVLAMKPWLPQDVAKRINYR
jgi:membrane protein required for colicin V production